MRKQDILEKVNKIKQENEEKEKRRREKTYRKQFSKIFIYFAIFLLSIVTKNLQIILFTFFLFLGNVLIYLYFLKTGKIQPKKKSKTNDIDDLYRKYVSPDDVLLFDKAGTGKTFGYIKPNLAQENEDNKVK